MPRVADPLAKARLLRAARTEFAAQGLSAARVEDIARRAGMAKGSFYLHFQNKEQAFIDIVDVFFAEAGRLTENCRADLDRIRTPDEVFSAFREQDIHIFEFLWENRDVLRMIIDGTSPTYSHILDAFLDSRATIAADDIRRFQERGLYRPDVDPHLVARIITGGYYNLARLITQLKVKPDLATYIDTVLKVFLEGLLHRPKAPKTTRRPHS